MPVRIYDIARRLGLESKQVIAIAHDLGIAQAKVPSSSLDKITAEYLIEQIGGSKSEPQPAQPPKEEQPILIVSAPVEEIEDQPEPDVPELPSEPIIEEKETSKEPERYPVEDSQEAAAETVMIEEPTLETAVEEVEEVISETTELPKESVTSTDIPEPTPEVMPEAFQEDEPTEINQEDAPSPATTTEPVTEESPAPPPATVAPQGPKLGDKVGFIDLKDHPTSRDRGRGGRDRKEKTKKAPVKEAQKPEPQQPRFGRRPEPVKRPQPSRPRPPAPAPTGELISLKPPIIVRDLAEKLNRKPFQVIADLMELNVFANVNQSIEEEIAIKICSKYGFRFEVEKRDRGRGAVAPTKKVALDIEDKPEDLEVRAPVVTIMGHVDHGKTTLLDYIRHANVAAKETGGITQHIGAYTIQYPHPERPKELHQITFLDTPGHAAFSAMRARGANVTDIVILVVAADDGIMPQTVEALDHARAAEVPIMVAVNKCDHPSADPLKVRKQLQDRGLMCEEWGGETIVIDVSAIKGTGVDKLLEMLLLQAEIMELKANARRQAKGNVIESGLQQGGPTATVLVRKGTLKQGDVVICGCHYGRVRALINEEGDRLKEAGPSTAVRVLGLNGVPEAGIEFSAVKNEKEARLLAEERTDAQRTAGLENRPKVTLETLFDTLSTGKIKSLSIVVKADTQGSAEAIVDALNKIESEKVRLNVIHSAVGTITESDVLLASASTAIIIGFHTRIDTGVAETAKREGVQIKLYSIIYELIEQVKEAMTGLLDPLMKDVALGTAEVRKVFDLSKGGSVAGCAVTNGRILRGKVRVLRRGNLIYEGSTQSIRRFQDEVNEVRSGMECGIRIDGFSTFESGDVIESYTTEKIAQEL